tara:strand:+ start:7445 stop:8068 length:624 start_codon:yes stop_codon:yes gene_type:complete
VKELYIERLISITLKKIMKMNKINYNKKLFMLFFFIQFILSCGIYSFKGSIPSHINSVNIPLLINETPEFGVGEQITDEITNIFLDENILKISKNADSELRGTIISINDSPYTYSTNEEVTEYRFSIGINIIWFDLVNNQILMNKNYSNWGVYNLENDVSSDGIDNDFDGKIDNDDNDEIGDPRKFAITNAVKKISNSIINDISSIW